MRIRRDVGTSRSSPMAAVSFNSDITCMVCACPNGFGIFSTSPFSRLAWYSSKGGGFNFAEMFDKTNLLLLVGGIPAPEGFSDSSVVLWDHAKEERVWDITLPSQVVGLCCSLGTIVVALEQRVVVYSVSADFSNVSFERAVETVYNPLGVCAVGCAGGERSAVACPGPREGGIRVLIWRGESAARLAPGHVGRGERLLERAHKKPLICLALNADGSLLASASQRGTLVRLWATSQTDTPILLRELRRGTLDADISHIAFSTNSDTLCCASDSGTVHVFSLEDSDYSLMPASGFAATILSSIQAGQRAFALYDLGEREPSILCGIRGQVLLAVTSQGSIHECIIDVDTTTDERCSLKACNNFLLEGDDDWLAISGSESEASQGESDEDDDQ